MKDWTIKQLYDAMNRNLRDCHTESEYINCRAVCGREIRELAETISKSRTLTPGEAAIASQFGFH